MKKALDCNNFARIYLVRKIKLVSKGSKYRGPVNISWQEAKTQIPNGLNEYKEQLSSNKGISICNVCRWKNRITSPIDDNISNLKTNNSALSIVMF